MEVKPDIQQPLGAVSVDRVIQNKIDFLTGDRLDLQEHESASNQAGELTKDDQLFTEQASTLVDHDSDLNTKSNPLEHSALYIAPYFNVRNLQCYTAPYTPPYVAPYVGPYGGPYGGPYAAPYAGPYGGLLHHHMMSLCIFIY